MKRTKWYAGLAGFPGRKPDGNLRSWSSTHLKRRFPVQRIKENHRRFADFLHSHGRQMKREMVAAQLGTSVRR